MFKKYFILFGLLFVLFPSNSYANVDQTNAFSFTYDCINGEGILKTDFNLGGHHHYYRQYKINKPGIIEIADGNHTTIAKSTNISISGCDFVPNNCTITHEGEWEYIPGEDKEIITLSIDTDLSVEKDGNVLKIFGSGTTEIININFEDLYVGSGKNLEISLNDGGIKLLEYGYNQDGNLDSQVVREITLNNRILDGKKEFYYDVSSDNKIIKVFQRKFKKESSGIAKSSSNTYDIYKAYTGLNTGGGTCADPVGKSNNGYCTGLDYWDYNQHHYTTTKVKLFSVSIECNKTEYSDGSSKITSKTYNGTLGGIVSPEFGGNLKINGVYEGGWGVTLFSNDNLEVEGLEYKKLGKVGDRSLGIKKVEASIKKDDITLGKDVYVLSSEKNSVGRLPKMNFNIKDNNGKSLTTKPGNYQLVLTFFTNSGQQIGTYEFPLTIIPNNDLKINYKWLDKTSVYATNKENDKIQVCAKITDNYGNEINKEYLVGNNNVIIEEGVKDLNNRQVLEVSDISFKNSNFCFKINSLAPANKKLKFKIKVPLHKEDLSLDFNGRYKNLLIETQKLNFKFPLKVNLSSDETLQIGKMINFNLDFINNGNLSFSNGRVYLSINNLKLENGHYFKDFVVLDNRISSSDLKAKFKGIIDANSNTLKSPKLKISGLPVAYSISGKFVKYKLQDSNEIGGNCNLDTLGVKVKGTLQGQGKQVLTGQKGNVSDLTKGNLRKQIRSNAYKLIKGLSSGTEVNGIKYVVGDIELSGDQTYETLIVKDGNVIITGDLNPSKKKLGIIVLKDNYDVKKDYNNAGNVYVDKDVENINAVIYADGAFRSADENGNFYPDNQLEKQLKLYGSLFTRNTIGGAVKGNTNFTLPGGESTTNYKLASLYDLNYIRKVSPQCDISGKQKENSYSFIIEYDPTIQSNPPKGF